MPVYKHSGEIGSAAFVAPPLAMLAALVLSLIYAYIDVWSPITGYISILFVLGLAIGLMFSVRMITKLTKCRSPGFALALGLFTGVFALYASWAFFEYALLSRFDDSFDAGMLDVLLAPLAVWEIALNINETGWYSIRGITPSGGVLWFFWGVEALMIVGGAGLGGLTALEGEVFCEGCQAWCDESAVKPRLHTPQDLMQLQNLSSADLSALEALPAAGAGDNPHLWVEIKRCLGCDRTAAAQLKLVKFETNDKGEVSESTANLGSVHLVGAGELSRFEALAGRPVEVP